MRIQSYKAQYHTKAVMLKGDEAEQITGYPAEGVCPFGISDDIQVYLDKSLSDFKKYILHVVVEIVQ